jgi:cellulose synthase operon protein C
MQGTYNARSTDCKAIGRPPRLEQRIGARLGLAWGLTLAVTLAACTASAQPLSNDEQAALVLASARRGYQEGNYPFAVDRFREFINKYGGHKDAIAARYGLGLALVEGPRDYPAAIEALGGVVGTADFVDRPTALYYVGLAQRSLGRSELALVAARPQEAQQHREAARRRFEQALPQFAAAATAFAARAKDLKQRNQTQPNPAQPDPKQPEPKQAAVNGPAAGRLPLDLEWQVRAICDQAEMLLELDKFADARALVDALLADPILANSRYRQTALYLQGYAAFALHDYLAAGRALGELAPFDNPALGLHARYLLARTHHLADERPAAAAQYDALLAAYEDQKKLAPQLLQNGQQLLGNWNERQRLESLQHDPPPDYVARASFYWGVLLYEDGKVNEALARFTSFPQQYSKHVLVPEAQFRQGVCQVQLRQFPDGIRNLQPYVEHPQLADQALAWLARAALGSADGSNLQAYEQSVRSACELFRRAVDKAGARAGSDPAAKLRRGDLLLEQGDTQQLIKLYREAVGSYQQAINENNSPDRAEETLARLATALHLAGQYAESDTACQKFISLYPRGSLLPAVLFRHAENAFLVANAAAANPHLGNRDAELQRLFGEAIKRYQVVADNYPEFESVAAARQGIALSLYRLGKYEEARAILADIPESDRVGELATVPYVLADCLIRTLPDDMSDALAAARVMQQVEEAINLLGGFLQSQPKSPQAPDALLKLGYCHQQAASIIIEPEGRKAALANARQAYEKVLSEFSKSPAQPYAAFERAKCLEMAGDVGAAIGEFQRFSGEPLNKSAIAPLALIRLSILWRNEKRTADAAAMLSQARSQHEAAMAADPERRDWVPLLQYHHGLAVKDSGKLPEARRLFEHITDQFPNRPEAVEAAWRAGQCRKDEALIKLDAARKILEKPDASSDQKSTAFGLRDEAARQLTDAGAYLEQRSAIAARQESAQQAVGSTGQLRLIYEAAWCHRLAGQAQIEVARQKLTTEGLENLRQQAASAAAGQAPPVIRAPDVALSAVPVQEGEKRARALYAALIAAGPDTQLALDGRLELAEMLAQRDEHQPALKLLGEALDKEPPPELTDRIELRRADSLLALDDIPQALRRFELLAKDEKHALAAEARGRAGECYFRQQDWTHAVERLIVFRDQGPFQNLPGVSDRALLRLGQAQGQLKQWDASRQSFETLINRFGQSRWVDEARFGIGWTRQNQNQHDEAISQYNQVVGRTGAEVAARAQLQIGLCRFDQKRYAEAAPALLAVAMTYNYPELSSMALLEAARAYNELKQPAEATKLLERVTKEQAGTRWAELAQARLAEMK